MSKYTDQWYKSKGFRVENTGGNCTAFRKDLTEVGLFILVTVPDEPMRPNELGEPVTASLYCNESSDPIAVISRQAPDSDALFQQFQWGRWTKQ